MAFFDVGKSNCGRNFMLSSCYDDHDGWKGKKSRGFDRLFIKKKRYQSIQTQPHVPLCKKCRGILYTGPYVRSSKLRWMDGVQQVGHQTGDVPPISGSWNDWVDKSYKSIGRGCWSCLLCFFCPVGLCVSFMNNSMVSIIMKTQQYGGWVVKHTGGFLYRSTYKFVLFPIAIR